MKNGIPRLRYVLEKSLYMEDNINKIWHSPPTEIFTEQVRDKHDCHCCYKQVFKNNIVLALETEI